MTTKTDVTQPNDTKRFREAYSDRFVDAALVLLESNNGNIKKTARDLDMPYSTLKAWKSGQRGLRHSELSRDAIKAELIPMFFDGARDFYKSAYEEMEDMSPYQRLIAAGISTDKLVNLSGIPTHTVEVKVLGAIAHAVTPWVADDEAEGELVEGELVDDDAGR